MWGCEVSEAGCGGKVGVQREGAGMSDWLKRQFYP